MMLCQGDSYLLEGEGEILLCEPEGNSFRVLLQDSIFYPEGGGQPADKGRLGVAAVLDVKRIDGKVWHIIDQELALGEYKQEIDWIRRFDHMQQHSGQHLLTAVILKLFGWSTVGFHLGEITSYIDLDCNAATKEQLLVIESEVDEYIRKSLKVTSRVISFEQFGKDSSVRSRRFPKGFRGDVRLVDIDGLDSNTCGGTHVSNLSELQCVSLIKTERVNGRVRLHFLVGGRVRKFLRDTITQQQQLTSIFNQGPYEHVQIAQKWGDERKSVGRQLKKLQQELAQYLGASLSRKEPSTLFRNEADMKMLSMIANCALRLNPYARFAISGNGVFVVQSPNAATKKELILSILDGRGGGKSPRLQGKCNQPERIEELAAIL
jgi:misacylated tRNA(Ala) deacylase